MPSPDFEPNEENLGKNCMWWTLGGVAFMECSYPRLELQGRRSCEGIIDDVCLFIKDGRQPMSLSEEQIVELRTRTPDFDKSYIPPGDTV